jgi:hypothetical protein
VNMNWPLVAAILAVLAVPFGIAVIQDVGREDPLPAEASIGAGHDDEGGDIEIDRDELAGETAGEAHDWQETPVMDIGFYERVFVADGRGPGLHGALAGARFGMTRDQVRAEAPGLWRWAAQGLSEFRPAAAGLRFRERGGAGLSAVAIRFPDDRRAARVLTAAWGPPVEARGQDQRTRWFWFDERSGTRAVLTEGLASTSAEVVLEPALPVATIYRRGHGFAFETRPILGATPAELVAAYGSDFELDPSSPRAARLEVAPTDYALDRTRCTIAFEDGKAVALQVVIDHSGRADFGPIALDQLRAELGPVRDAELDPDGNRWTFDDDIAVHQFPASPQIVVSASRP